MANILASPGVSISVIDESIYVSSGAGTVPMIAIATALSGNMMSHSVISMRRSKRGGSGAGISINVNSCFSHCQRLRFIIRWE